MGLHGSLTVRTFLYVSLQIISFVFNFFKSKLNFIKRNLNVSISLIESNYFKAKVAKLKIFFNNDLLVLVNQISEIIYIKQTLRSFNPSIHLDILGDPDFLA